MTQKIEKSGAVIDAKENENPLGDKSVKGEVLEQAKKLREKKDNKKKKSAGKTGKPEKKGPGVIESILEFVTKAGEKGVSKKAILAKLVARFPERAVDGMSKTINVQLPKRMSRERKIKIVKLENGNFMLKLQVKKENNKVKKLEKVA
ncbi:MAG: hypothetical protein WCX48_09735 [Bacteroidales bacterium]